MDEVFSEWVIVDTIGNILGSFNDLLDSLDYAEGLVKRIKSEVKVVHRTALEN